jgi:hypothetical protein
VILGLLIIQAIWLAFTVQFPMAFDESYHFGIIQVYAQQWLPFIITEPAGASGYGVITRYDSYMFHYLMSFPHRLFSVFVSDWASQIIFLRLINVALFAGGIVLFQRLLTRFNVSRALVHFVLLMFVLIPVVPTLAATINYDNFVFLLVPIVVGLTLTCVTSLLKNNTIPASSLVLLMSVGFIGSLSKYAFVPIFVGALLCVCIAWLRGRHKVKALKSIVPSFKKIPLRTKIILSIFFVISTGLFLERYGGNLVVYRSFEPACTQVKSLDECLSYGPWGRNYRLAANVAANNPPLDPALLEYPGAWIGQSLYKLYFTINYDFAESDPLPIPYTVAGIIGGIGVILSLVFWKRIWRRDKRLLVLVTVSAVYVGGLFAVNFSEFLKYHTIVAVNGRYLILVLPFILLIIGLAYKHLFDRLLKQHARSFTAIFSIIILLLALQGGGAMTYLLRSQPIWYWQYQPLVDFNTGLKNVITPVVFGAKDDSSQ